MVVIDNWRKLRNLIVDLPKVELHVHIEGTLELEMIINLAKRNSIDIPDDKLELISNFHKQSLDLPSFLETYYFGVCVLQHELDFYDLTYAYLKKRILKV